MLDSYRRRDLTRLLLDNGITPEDCDFLKQSAHFHEHGHAAPPIPPPIQLPVILDAPEGELAYAEKVLCHVNKKISAIKSVKDRLKCGLKDAKDLVDAYTATEAFRAAKEQRYFVY